MKKLPTRTSLVLAISVVLLAGCQSPETNQNLQTILPTSQVEEAFPNQEGITKTTYYLGRKVEYQEINGQAVFQGDIIIHPSQMSNDGNTNITQEATYRTLPSTRWANKIVYYDFEASFEDRQRVTGAIAHWEANSPIRFFRRNNKNDKSQDHYIIFNTGSGCSSVVGSIGNKSQVITASPVCTMGNMIHEIGHALGLYHEQARKDRDQYITINWGNMKAVHQINFKTYIELGTDGNESAGGLDFNSIMMYGSSAFSKNGQPTIIKKGGGTFLEQRVGLSAQDKATIAEMYK